MTSLVQTGQRALELQRLRVSWRDMDIRRVATPTPFNINAIFEQLFIIRVSLCMLFRFGADTRNPLGGDV